MRTFYALGMCHAFMVLEDLSGLYSWTAASSLSCGCRLFLQRGFHIVQWPLLFSNQSNRENKNTTMIYLVSSCGTVQFLSGTRHSLS
jgi:hypothetical protein